MEVKSKSYNTLYKINKPVYHGGLMPLQWIFVLTVFFGAWMGLGWPSIFIMAPAIWVITIIAKENQKGNPSYVDSLVVWLSLKRRFEDKSVVLKLIKNKSGKRN